MIDDSKPNPRIGMEHIHRHGGDEDREIQTECADQKEHDQD
jgi:hypothetical protein